MTEVSVPEIVRHGSVELPASSSALIVVDMQNDFAHPDGALYGPETRRVLPNIQDAIDKARAAGVPVIFTQDWHGEDDPEFRIWGEHAKANTWGSEIVAELAPRQNEPRIRKLRYDAFFGTELDQRLRVLSVKHVVVTGTVANICVLHTAGSAALRWYDVVVLEDGVAALTPFDKAATLRQVSFLYAGRVTNTEGLKFRDA